MKAGLSGPFLVYGCTSHLEIIYVIISSIALFQLDGPERDRRQNLIQKNVVKLLKINPFKCQGIKAICKQLK